MAKRPAKSAVGAIEAPPPPEHPVPAPIPLTGVVGQDRAIGILLDAMRAERVHHAWVFHGPTGVGKFTTALAFAAVVLDPTSAPTLTGGLAPDPESHTQRLLRAGAHPDLHVIRKELARFHDDAKVRERKQTNIPLDVVRSFMLEPAALNATVRTSAPVAKVFIVDEAEMLAGASQNAVLKFLEEPPPRTLVILVTDSEERLLPTIRSRCQRVFFPPLSQADMQRCVRASGLELDPAATPWLLEFADGSPGVLHGAVRHGLWAWQQRLAPLLAASDGASYRVELGSTMADLADEWAEAWVKANPYASKEGANKAGADWVFRVVASHLRGRLRRGASAGAWRRVEALREAEREIDSNVNQTFVFEKLAAELCARATPAR
ncbi:MAG: AAA family ATPase [Planctomycetota bacterium]|nr:AAA family ATPase [Planctomycetota bacterium]